MEHFPRTSQRCKGPYSPVWASSQPLLELLFAAGVGATRRELRRMTRRGGVALEWWAHPFEPAQALAYPRAALLDAYCVGANTYLRTKALVVWQPVLPLELEMRQPFQAGVLIVKHGQSLTRIALYPEGTA